MIVQKLNRILDGNDVAGLLVVDAVEQRRQGEDFPDPRSGDQDDAIAEACDFPELRWQSQTANSGMRLESRATTAQLPRWMKHSPEAGQPGRPKEYRRSLLAQHIDGLLLSPMGSGDAPGVVSVEPRPAPAPESAVHDFHLRGTAGRENQVTHFFRCAQHGRQQGMWLLFRNAMRLERACSGAGLVMPFRLSGF